MITTSQVSQWEIDIKYFRDQLESLRAENSTLRTDCERERMRLAACGVVAMSDTPESAKQARDMHPDYRSASCDDVARRVDECMRLRAERDTLITSLARQTARLAEITDLHAAYSHSQQQFLDGEEERDTLRELVREAMDYEGRDGKWYERAEKALSNQPSKEPL